MLAHSAHPYTYAAEERRENMPSCHPSDPSIVLKHYATRPRSIDLPRHASFTEDILPVPTRDEPVYGNPATKPYFYDVPQNQFQKSHSSGHRLVHPCMSISSQAESQAHHASAFHRYQDPNIRSSAHQNPISNSVYTLATHMAVQSRQQCPTGLVADRLDIESGLGSSSSSGKSSASSLVRGAGESVLAGFDWAGGKLANLFGVSQPKYQWAMDEHELLRKQAKSEVELDRLAKSAQFFEQRCIV